MPGDHVARVLADIAHALNSADQADVRVRHVLDYLRLLVPYDCCALLEAEPGRAQKLVVLPEGGARGSLCEVLARLLRDLGEPATLHSGLPSPEVAAQLPYRSHLVLPIGAPEPRLQAARDMIDRQVTHMARLLDDLLDVSRVTRGKITLAPARLDVREVVRHAVETTRPLMEQRAHQLHVHLAPEPLWVEADGTRLTQVVGNLLTNAAKFTPSGGTVEGNVSATGDRAEVRVRDTGVGLVPEALDRIFDLFSQEDASLDRQHGGLGIGLTLVERLVA